MRIFLTNHCIVDFDIVVNPKRKPNKWTANIEHATLEGLKEYIRKMYQPPALENDGVELNLMNDGEKYFPHNDQECSAYSYQRTISSLPYS